VKRDDAAALLAHVASLESPPPRTPFELAPSHFLEALYERERCVADGDQSVALADIANHAALNRADFVDIHGAALDRQLLLILAEQMGVRVTPEEQVAEREAFCRRLGLATAGALDEWRGRNDLTQAELDRLLIELAVQRKLRIWLVGRRYMRRTTQPVLDELRCRGLYEATRRDAFFQHGLAAADEGATGYPDNVAALAEEHRRSVAAGPEADGRGSYGAWALEHGFKDEADLMLELVRARKARGRLAGLAEEVARLIPV
jgi:hypothetical protein